MRVYNSHKNTWRTATSIMPSGQSISWGSLAVRNDTLVYMCGSRNFLSTNYFNTVRIGVIDQNDRANINWTTAPNPFPGQTRTFFDTYPWQEGLIMTGGSTDNTFETTSDECYYYEVGADRWTQLPPKPTPWVTGNSGSFLVGNAWKLVCTAGYNNGYISPTEILTSPLLSNNEFESSGKCGWKNFKIIGNKNPSLKICLDQEASLEILLYDLSGALVSTVSKKTYAMGENEIILNHNDLAAGAYLCMIKNKNESISKKLILLR